jgi:GH15 family glucan-1,4-alpha-glucosidase
VLVTTWHAQGGWVVVRDALTLGPRQLGLYAEEFDTATGRHVGNFPQAVSHLALLEAVARIILAERFDEYTG